MMHRLGIKARVLLLAMLPIAVISIALTWYFISSRLQDMDQAIEDQGQAMARQLAQACEYGLFIGEAALLEDLAQGLSKNDAVKTVRIADRYGRVWVQLGAPAQLPAVDLTSEGSLLRTRDALFISEPVRSKPLLIATDVLGEAQSQTVGLVTLGISLEPTRARQRQILLNSFLLSSAVLVVAILMALRLGRDIVRPIGLLAEAVNWAGSSPSWSKASPAWRRNCGVSTKPCRAASRRPRPNSAGRPVMIPSRA